MTYEKRVLEEQANVQALREMTNDVIYRIDPKRKRRSYILNNLNIALNFLKYAEDGIVGLSNEINQNKRQINGR